jgi:hypothetical protein
MRSGVKGGVKGEGVLGNTLCYTLIARNMSYDCKIRLRRPHSRARRPTTSWGGSINLWS